MKEVTMTAARKKLGEMLKVATIEPVAVLKRGKYVAVNIAFEEYQRLISLDK